MATMNFDITSHYPISKLFLERQIKTFADACTFVRNLPYGRNLNESNLTTVFTDNHATSATKHALLKQIAIENNVSNVKLMLGVIKMNKHNTPEVGKILDKYLLPYVLEAHTYIKVDGEIIDCTKKNSSKDDFIADLCFEIEIEPYQISDYKVNLHKALLEDWLLMTPDNYLQFKDLWIIREKCIDAISRDINSNLQIQESN